MPGFDLRDAVRGLIRDRFYSAMTVVTLALTIGATTAVFSIVNGVLLKPLAYRESHQLVAIRELWREFVNRYPGIEVNEQHFEYWRTHAKSFESLAQYIPLPANLTGVGDAARIVLVHTSASLFDVLQVPVARGRSLNAADERMDRADVAVLTDALWKERFGSDPGILGRAITLDGKPHQIVGVLPSGFRLPVEGNLTAKVDAFVPIKVDADKVGWVGDHNNAAIGRLRHGVTVEQARAELDVLQQQVSVLATKQAHDSVTLSSVVIPLAETVVGGARRGLLLLFGAIAAVLLIACSNLANLSLTRTLGRAREVAIRSALGAGQARLVRRAVLEQVVLAAVGGTLGLWVAWGVLAVFVRTAPIDLPRVNEIVLDGRVILFAVAISMAAALGVAVLPAWRMGRADVEAPLRAGSVTVTADRQGKAARSMLLAFQVALSVALLVVTGLLATSFVRLLGVDKGFTSDHVLVVPIAFPASTYEENPVRLAAYDRLLASIHALPGVAGVTTTSMLPLGGQGQVNSVAPEGTTLRRSELPAANFRFVAPDFFRTIGIQVLRGRAFTDGDRRNDRPAPALISVSTAARLWPGADPIGKRFSRGNAGEQGFEVVGIVVDARTTAVDRQPPLMVYVPYWWRSRPTTTLLVKSDTEPALLTASITRAIHAVNPDIAVGQTRSLEDVVDSWFAGRRYQMRLFVAFGIVALVIATLGVYAVTSYGVSRRRREMNIRVALGATREQVLRMILRQGAVPLGLGIVAGVTAAVAVGRVTASLLFEVDARDPRIIGAVAVVVGTVGLAASIAAAIQGLVLNPAAALRDE